MLCCCALAAVAAAAAKAKREKCIVAVGLDDGLKGKGSENQTARRVQSCVLRWVVAPFYEIT